MIVKVWRACTILSCFIYTVCAKPLANQDARSGFLQPSTTAANIREAHRKSGPWSTWAHRVGTCHLKSHHRHTTLLSHTAVVITLRRKKNTQASNLLSRVHYCWVVMEYPRTQKHKLFPRFDDYQQQRTQSYHGFLENPCFFHDFPSWLLFTV